LAVPILWRKGIVDTIISDEIAPDISPKMRMVRFITWLL
jgi:hypothetical protein